MSDATPDHAKAQRSYRGTYVRTSTLIEPIDKMKDILSILGCHGGHVLQIARPKEVFDRGMRFL